MVAPIFWLGEEAPLGERMVQSLSSEPTSDNAEVRASAI